MQGIFISYRRNDTSGITGRIFDNLVLEFGPDQVFMDVDGIEPGLDFHEVLSERVGGCQIFLAVIGRRWLSEQDANGMRRIDQENDFVRIEIESALNRDIRVIPILFDGAAMPSADDLPEAIRSLSRRSALEIGHANFHGDFSRLVKVLHKVLPPKLPAGESPVEEEKRPEVPGGSLLRSRMLAALESFSMVDDISIAPSIPEKKLIAARERCEVPAEVEVFALIDFTAFGNARDALLVTERGISYHHSCATPERQDFTFEQLRDSSLETNGIWEIRVGQGKLSSAGGPKRSVTVDFLRAVARAAGGE